MSQIIPRLAEITEREIIGKANTNFNYIHKISLIGREVSHPLAESINKYVSCYTDPQHNLLQNTTQPPPVTRGKRT